MSEKRTPPKLADAYVANFATLRRAEENGDLALVSAIRKADQAAVALVCAMQPIEVEGQETQIRPIPLAVMVEGDPFELFEDPTV